MENQQQKNVVLDDITSHSTKKNSKIVLVAFFLMACFSMYGEIMLLPSLPTIVRDPKFSSGANYVAWILSIYLLVGAVVTPIAGALGDKYGKKRMLMLCMSFFAIAQFGSAFAWSMPSLIFFRGIQGLGLGQFPLAMGIIRDTFPSDIIPIALGIVSSSFSIGVTIGFLGGGWVSENFDWQINFFFSGFGLLFLLVFIYFYVDAPFVPNNMKLDVFGCFIIGFSVLSLMFGLTEAKTKEFTELSVWGCILLAIIIFFWFVVHSLRVENPLIPKKLIEIPEVIIVTVSAFVIGFCMFLVYQTVPFFISLPINSYYVPGVGNVTIDPPLGYHGVTSTLTSGLWMSAGALSQLPMAAFAGKYARKFGPMRMMSFGFIGSALVTFLMFYWNRTTVSIIVTQILFGATIAPIQVLLMTCLADYAPQEIFGTATGFNSLLRSIGSTLGPVVSELITSKYLRVFNTPAGTFFMNEPEGYTYCWLLAGIVSFISGTILFIIRNKAGTSSISSENEEDPSTVDRELAESKTPVNLELCENETSKLEFEISNLVEESQHTQISSLLQKAFEKHEGNLCESEIVCELRKKDAIVFERIVIVDDIIVGYGCVVKVTVDSETDKVYALGPLAILPNYQRLGLGTKIVESLLTSLKEIEANGCVVLGEFDFYNRFGFERDEEVTSAFSQDHFLTVKFGNEDFKGLVEYDELFYKSEIDS
eukprot:TRINITY_DN2282_c0_g1_i1.p1 TRINITY_DN2282_c0_g1~~TRINITY_DN2282_c0_g1_i1.p1  ORF type:complete len:717 (+),score=211.95 TRINITY_DN2282_c0_g1_i1:39-2153(+)